MKGFLKRAATIFFIATAAQSSVVSARGVIEFSTAFSFTRSNYTQDDFAWRRLWGASLAYHFSKLSGIELSFEDVVDRTYIKNYQDTTFRDRVYSASWIQSLLGEGQPIQPYFKFGVGQLNRDASGSYAGGGSPVRRVDSLTVVVAAGARLYLSKSFAIRSEVTSYLSGGAISTWKDNIAITLGASVFF